MYEIITHTIYGNILQIQYIDEAGYFKSQIMPIDGYNEGVLSGAYGLTSSLTAGFL